MTPLPQYARWFSCLGVLCAIALWAGCGGKGADDGTGSGKAKLRRIIIVTNGPDPFWDTCEAGAKAAEQELNLSEQGFIVDFQRGDFTDKRQIDMLKQYALAGDVAAVGISIFNPDSRNLAEEMRGLQKQGVKVVTIDSDLNRNDFRDARYAYLGTDNIIGGRELGRAAKSVNANAKYAFFVGDVGVSNAKERMNGFVEGIGGDEAKELSRMGDGGDRTTARRNVESTLDRNADCDMLVGIWAYNTPQIVNVVQDRKLNDKVSVMCFDAAEAAIHGMAAGVVDVMVVQNPYQMGYDGVRLMHALVTDNQEAVKEFYPVYSQTDENDFYRTELRVVVPDGDSPITRDLFEPETVFFKFSEFTEWLKSRGLVSS